jgi:DNA-binding transcriptional MerR regulator
LVLAERFFDRGGLRMTFDLSDLCGRGGVTARTIRYYVQQGLLPSPGLGAGARYTEAHLARLRLIRRLQSEHLPLAEIRRSLEALDDDAIRALLKAPPPRKGPAATSAVDYVRSILGGNASSPVARGRRPPPVPNLPPAASAGGSARAGRLVADRAQWERIALTADVELHVRRPLSREDNRRVEKLLEKARELFRPEEV